MAKARILAHIHLPMKRGDDRHTCDKTGNPSVDCAVQQMCLDEINPVRTHGSQ